MFPMMKPIGDYYRLIGKIINQPSNHQNSFSVLCSGDYLKLRYAFTRTLNILAYLGMTVLKVLNQTKMTKPLLKI